MDLNEAKAIYITAKQNYSKIIENYDRSVPGSRGARFQAYQELNAAELDLMDLSIDKIEDETGEDLSKVHKDIESSVFARSKCCEEVFVHLA